MERDSGREKAQGRTARNAVLAGANTDTVGRYGSGVKEHLAGYIGEDRQTGQTLNKGLKAISGETISPKQPYQSVKAQAGFAAEVKTAARENAEKAIAGDKVRVTRTDDVSKALQNADGQSVGGVNHPLYDLISVGEDGSYIEGSARQLKYVGRDAKECCNRLLQKKFDKYRDAGAAIEVPKDFYDGVQAELDGRIGKLKGQIAKAEAGGNTEQLEKLRERLKRAEQTKETLKQGQLTTDEAIEARLHPKLSTAKDVGRLAHRGGLEAAKTGAAIGGGMSFIRNAVAVYKGDEEPGEALLRVTGDTASAAGLSYATGFLGSAVKGGMQNAKSACARALSDSALPAMIATTALETGKTIYRFADGQIDGAQCLNELGEKGSGIAASTIGAAAGQAVIPIPIVGAMVGSMCGYALSSMYYHILTAALNEAKLAKEERQWVESECAEAILAIREYRLEMELAARNYFMDHVPAFHAACSEMREAFNTGNADLFIAGANRVTEALGEEPLFRTLDEFDALMAGEAPITI